MRILDVRQPGQALLELRGHCAPLNAVEWSPTRRGRLATGADDALVLVWDLMNSHVGASLNGADAGSNSNNNGAGGGNNGAATATAAATPGGQTVGAKGPYSAWRCEFEVGNLSWAPQSRLSAASGSEDWLGVSGGRGIWGVQLGN